MKSFDPPDAFRQQQEDELRRLIGECLRGMAGEILAGAEPEAAADGRAQFLAKLFVDSAIECWRRGAITAATAGSAMALAAASEGRH